MLVLTRKNGQTIRIGGSIEIKVISAGPNRVRIGISAPAHVAVQRGELVVDGFHNGEASRSDSPHPPLLATDDEYEFALAGESVVDLGSDWSV